MPAIRDLVTNGKLPAAPDIHDKWIAWSFKNWRSYSKKDVTYWRNRAENEKEQGLGEESKKSYGRIQMDEKGNEFVEKRYIHISDVFANEDECRKASDAHYGVSASGDAFNEPIEKTATAPDGFGSKQTALDFLPSIVKSCVVNGVVDEEKLNSTIESNPILIDNLPEKNNDPDVRKAINLENAQQGDGIPF